MKIDHERTKDEANLLGYPMISEYKFLGVVISDKLRFKTEAVSRKVKMKPVWKSLEQAALKISRRRHKYYALNTLGYSKANYMLDLLATLDKDMIKNYENVNGSSSVEDLLSTS